MDEWTTKLDSGAQVDAIYRLCKSVWYGPSSKTINYK